MVKHIEVVYGKSIMAEDIKLLENYVVFTMDPAWELCKPFFSNYPPKAVIEIDTLDQERLDDMYAQLSTTVLSDGVRIVGVGGGTVLDAAKYFAYLQNTIPLLIPSITSTNTPFSDFISIRKNGGPFGFKVDGYPKRVIVDYDLIRLANPRYNRAGFGDLLYMQTTLNDWKLMHERGIGAAIDNGLESEIMEIMDLTMKHAVEIGSMTETGIRILMENTYRSSLMIMENLSMPIGAGSEHLFAWTMDLLADMPLVHGEIVSLGIVISSYLQSDYLSDSRFLELRKALDEAKVVYHPDEIGIKWNDIEKALLSVEEYNRRVRNFHTVFELTEWTPEVLRRVKDYVYNGI
jgi:glycerol-1-phosphate dehydrogenase [NAD(P)+]